jgi:hypothetical protein
MPLERLATIERFRDIHDIGSIGIDAPFAKFVSAVFANIAVVREAKTGLQNLPYVQMARKDGNGVGSGLAAVGVKQRSALLSLVFRRIGGSLAQKCPRPVQFAPGRGHFVLAVDSSGLGNNILEFRSKPTDLLQQRMPNLE